MNKALRFAILAAVTVAVAQPSRARQLTPDEALQRATSQQAPGMLKTKGAAVRSYNLVYKASAAKAATPMVYVFAGADGFVVTPADDEFAPVLGYGDKGAVSGDAIPPQMKWWLGEYAREMEYCLSNRPEEAPSAPRAIIVDNKSVISPLVKTKWNQDTPFNNLCPTLDITYNGQSSSEPTVTGCVATAMAQIMKYHNWPDVGVGSNSYEWQKYSNSAKKTLSCDFSTVRFDWSNMPDTYTSGSYNSAQASAVAQLMYACGVSVNMNYDAARNGGSGAVTANVATALQKYFKYSRSAHVIERDGMSYTEWENTIYAELQAKRPVLLSGQSNEGGHAFVCDGYAGDRYYHINWGWGGMSDGNFLLCRLNPDDQGIGSSEGGYNSGQNIVCGIQPVRNGNDTGTAAPGRPEFTFNLGYTVSNGSYNYIASRVQNGKTEEGWFRNGGGDNFQGYFGTILTDPVTGATALETKIYRVNLQPRYGYKQYPILSGQTPADGTYYAYPAYWTGNETTAHRMDHAAGYVDHVVIKVQNGAITSASVPDMSDAMPDLTALYLAVPDHINLGTAANFSTSIANNSDETDYYGTVSFCYAAKGNTSALKSVKVDFDVPAGLSIPYSFAHTFSGISAGQYEGWFTDSNDRVISNRFPFTVQAAGSALTGNYSLTAISPVNFTAGVNTTVEVLMHNSNASDSYYSQFIYTFTDRSNASNVVAVNSPANGAWNPLTDTNANYRLSFDVQFSRNGIYDLVVKRRKYTYSNGYVYATNDYETISTPIKITVGNNAQSVTLNENSVTLDVSGTRQLTATVLPADALDKTVAWTSSRPDVVSVDNTGKITGLTDGKANVYAATMNGKVSVCAVTVGTGTGVDDITVDTDDPVTAVYTLQGIRIADTTANLPRGLYIVTTAQGHTRKLAL